MAAAAAIAASHAATSFAATRTAAGVDASLHAAISPASARAAAGASAPRTAASAFAENWIKAYPCCLQTHAAIDAALAVGGVPDGRIVVAVHPLSRQAAGLDGVRDGLQAKFSIPYLTAYALLHGAPRLASFDGVDRHVAALAARVEVRTDRALGSNEARSRSTARSRHASPRRAARPRTRSTPRRSP